jgi:SAM-dependent methyltransferase
VALYGENYTRYQLDRGLARRVVRQLYLRSAARQLRGPTVDFGCGVGDLLQLLPAGSLGLDINPVSVDYCRSRGLDARLYDGDADGWNLEPLGSTRGLQSLVISHVLEHLEQPMEKLARLLRACERLGIEHALVVVPGLRAYERDDTHCTFVDLPMLSSTAATAGTGFRMICSRYFPCNLRVIAQGLPHHELQVSYRRVGEGRPTTPAPRRP